MTPFFSLEMTESDLIQRTPHVHVQSESCAHTSAVKSTVLQVYSAPKSTRRRFRSIPPATTSTHVPSRAMCRVAPIPTVICFWHTSLRVQSHHKISPCSNTRHLPRARRERRPTTPSVPESPQESLCLSLSSPRMEPNRLKPVPDASARVATNLVSHKKRKRKRDKEENGK